MPTIPDAAIALFANQYGTASRRQLVDVAPSAKAVDNWVRHGLLIRLCRGVYRLRGAPVTPETRLMAAVLRCGDDALAGPRMSAALHGFEGFSLDGDIEVIAAPQRRLSNLGFSVASFVVSAGMLDADSAGVRALIERVYYRRLLDRMVLSG